MEDKGIAKQSLHVYVAVLFWTLWIYVEPKKTVIISQRTQEPAWQATYWEPVDQIPLWALVSEPIAAFWELQQWSSTVTSDFQRQSLHGFSGVIYIQCHWAQHPCPKRVPLLCHATRANGPRHPVSSAVREANDMDWSPQVGCREQQESDFLCGLWAFLWKSLESIKLGNK